MNLPLEGVRVIEVGQALAGPLAGAIMADMGADVIKVEKPDGGDDARAWGPPFGPDGVTSLYFHGQNRNKRSITLDLKNPGDVEALHRLCETADILIQNLRPGVVDEIGIGPAAMLARHPRLVYCSIWAFGATGPMRMKPGFDPLLQFVHEADAIAAFLLAVVRDVPGTFNVVGAGVLPLTTVIRLAGRVPLPVPHPLAAPMTGALWAAGLAEAPAGFVDYLRYLCVADAELAARDLGFRAHHTTRQAVLDFATAQHLRDVRLLRETVSR